MKILLGTLILILWAGCKDNPYGDRVLGKPADPNAKGQAQTPVPVTPPVPPEPPPPPIDPALRFSLSLPEVMLFVEGKSATYTAKASVPPPGKAILTFTGLPAGMVYDSQLETLSWLPDYTAGDDPFNPNSFRKVVIAQVILKSDADPISVVTKDFVIVIENATKP